MYVYFSVPIGVPGGSSGSMFTPIPTEVIADEPEVTGLDLLHKTKFTKLRHVEPLPDLAKVSEGLTKLELMLDAVIKVGRFFSENLSWFCFDKDTAPLYMFMLLQYVEGVLSIQEKPDNAVGRKLLDLVNSVPKMTPDEFEKMINSNMKASKHKNCL